MTLQQGWHAKHEPVFNDTNFPMLLRYRGISCKLPQKSKFHLCMYVCALYVLCGYVQAGVCVLVELMGNGVNTIITQPNPNFTEAQSNHYQ
jgi:hypothetical protein